MCTLEKKVDGELNINYIKWEKEDDIFFVDVKLTS